MEACSEHFQRLVENRARLEHRASITAVCRSSNRRPPTSWKGVRLPQADGMRDPIRSVLLEWTALCAVLAAGSQHGGTFPEVPAGLRSQMHAKPYEPPMIVSIFMRPFGSSSAKACPELPPLQPFAA